MQRHKPKHRKSLAFTLAELLITLGVIGLIATFTIPSVLMSTKEAENNAKAKETISILSQLTAEAMMSGMDRGSDFPQWAIAKLNVQKVCTAVDAGAGCPPGPLLGSGYSLQYIQLHNGVVIDFSNYFTNWGSWLVIDVNGVTTPPNREGQDRLWLSYNVLEVDVTHYAWGFIKRGTIVPSANHVDSVAKYKALFSK